ncbi:MAG TPA: hypothetical protein VGE52_12900, partial [Pirellulales bacterium]
QFDVKWLLRELALTETYSRSSETAGDAPPPPELFAVALERRASAEQLLRSLLVATLPIEESRDDAKLAAKFAELRPKAIKSFANPAKEPEDAYGATVQGALSLLNDEAFLKLFEPEAGNLTDRASQMAKPDQAIEALYLAILARRPTTEEQSDALTFLERFSGERRPAGLKHLAWALAASMEFSVIH